MTQRQTAGGQVSVDELREIRNAPVYTADGEEFGHVGEIWYDEDTRAARFLKVGRGALGLRAVCVPVQGGTLREDGFQVPYSRDQLEESPEFGEDEEWTDEREREFASYYGDAGAESDVDRDVSDGDAAITRSEEEVQVGKRDVEAGRVRLRKYDDETR
jgi:sporulation protein YlmC with PRC-barrel domain